MKQRSRQEGGDQTDKHHVTLAGTVLKPLKPKHKYRQIHEHRQTKKIPDRPRFFTKILPIRVLKSSFLCNGKVFSPNLCYDLYMY